MIPLRSTNCALCNLSMKQHKDVLSSPWCGGCIENLLLFLDKRDPTISAGFAILKLRREANKDHRTKTIEGLDRARLLGKKIGRPSKCEPEIKKQIAQMRDGGASYRQIASALKLSVSSVAREIQWIRGNK